MHFIFSLPQKAIGTHWLCIPDVHHFCASNSERNSTEKTNTNRRKQKRSSQLSIHPSPIIYACPVLGHMRGKLSVTALLGKSGANLTRYQDITCMIWWHPHTRYKSTPRFFLLLWLKWPPTRPLHLWGQQGFYWSQIFSFMNRQSISTGESQPYVRHMLSTHLMLSSYIVSHWAKIIQNRVPHGDLRHE